MKAKFLGSPRSAQVKCDACGKQHPLVGSQYEVGKQALRDGWISVLVNHEKLLQTTSKAFCPGCARKYFQAAFPELFDESAAQVIPLEKLTQLTK